MLPNGDSAVLLDFDTLDEVLGFYRAADRTRPAGLVDLVPGARTVLATCDPRVLPLRQLREWLETVVPVGSEAVAGASIGIDVRYDGEDLDVVANLLKLTTDDVIELHTTSTWTVAFGGFAPGFGYLVTEHARLVVPRRASPRTLVPAGAVGLAGEFSGIYPRASPGGWQLIGSTDARLWDPSREPPALLTPGATVRFRAVP
ncbi:MAG: allophanate hydrolase subunit [Microbacteriaceae bacterium]|nr:allophanate hydrolase subunit [Microbacteriaceae bacterium]